MNSVYTIAHWFIHDPLTGAAWFFGGGTLAVILYTYVHDYNMLTDRN